MPVSSPTLLLLSLYSVTILSLDVPNSCIAQSDTDNLLVKPIDDDDYPSLNVKCSNEFMIIDINKDENWLQYFTSSRLYHYAVYGPVRDEHSNWNEWLIPSMSQFLVSPDCSTCDVDSELNSIYKYESSYYGTPVANSCTQIPVSRIGCDMDYFTYECRVCESAKTRDPGYWVSYPVYNGLNDDSAQVIHDYHEIDSGTSLIYGLCLFTIRNANAIHFDDSFVYCKTVTHEDLFRENIIPRRKPSIGSNGRFCMCVKPEDVDTYSIDEPQNNTPEIEDEQTANVESQEDQTTFELYQSDFTDGTLRITTPGTYTIMEDITFDFKAPKEYMSGDLSTYNGDMDWWPTADQLEQYPGAGQNKDSYFLGFWAGITIECNDVILDLNGFKLEMSQAFYYQQAFFALISLSSQVFLPSQGPGFFGAEVDSAQNVIIRNGELGLTSHHGIQGNLNKDVYLENIQIHSFKTHGIQLNGFDGVHMTDVDIGPNIAVDKLSPWYSQMRHLLSTYKRMLNENEDVIQDLCFTFYGRDSCVTLGDLTADLQTVLDIAFEYAVLDKTPLEGDVHEDTWALWQQNKNVLLNTKGTPRTATLYGIFLNYVGSNVIAWYTGSESTQSKNVFMNNVHIHDLYHDTVENMGFSQGKDVGKQRIINCLASPLNAYHIFGERQVHTISKCNVYLEEFGGLPECVEFRADGLEYVGNTIVDIQIFAFKLIAEYDLSWNYCSGGASDMNALVEFAFDNTEFLPFTPVLVPSHDPMIHPGKGVLGLRLNGVEGVQINGLIVENIHSTTGLGTELGGSYTNIVSQQQPYMNGYSMNMAHGVSLTFTKQCVLNDIHVNNVVSDTGLSFGIALWYNTDVTVDEGGITIEHVYAGKELMVSDEFTADSYPNLIPEACAVRVYGDDNFYVSVDYEEDRVDQKCVVGHSGCLMEDGVYSHIGEVDNENSECESLAVGFELESRGPLWIRDYLGHLLSLVIAIVSGFLVIFYSSQFIRDCYHDKLASFKQCELAPLL
eukprot:178121_1